MRIRSGLVGALVVAAAAAAVPAARVWYGSRLTRLGPVEASPAASRLSVRIGERAEFSARAEGATGFSWRLWGRPVSSEPTWSYVPGPEEAGWQQVTVEVVGGNGERVGRSWDVGVVVAVLPEIEDVTPAPGPVTVAPGEGATFRCTAHLPGGRPSDRLAFEWTMDDRQILREERTAAEAASEFVLRPGGEPGPHRLRLHVTEDGRSASIVDWAVDVRAVPREVGPVAPVQPVSTEAAPVLAALPPGFADTVPPALFTEPGPPRAAPLRPPAPRPVRPQLIRAPGPRRLQAGVGDRLVLDARVEPDGATVAHRWIVDGRPIRRRGTRLEYEPTTPGQHRVEVTVESGRRAIGRDAWVISVQAARVPGAVRAANAHPVGPVESVPPRNGVPPRMRETVPVATSEPVRSAEPLPQRMPAAAPAVATTSSLAEGDVRRWLDDYARAWSRKDIAALRRMGQFRSAGDAAQLERYFESIDALQVEVRVLGLRVDGRRALVDFERIDTVTDPGGRHHELRLPPMRKEIEQTPEGLRFTGAAAHG